MNIRLEKRNKRIVERFNELYNLKRKRLDDVLKELSDEFYLSEDRIYSLVFYNKESREYYHEISENQKQPA